MNGNIEVSVIIPVYNAEKYLRQCLDSVVNQTLRESEIICVDDGSTDNSLAILREYEALDSRVKVLTQMNQYAGVARNNGMAVAKGEYLYFLDADDYCRKTLLQDAVRCAEEKQADIVVFDYYHKNVTARGAVYCTGLFKRNFTQARTIFSYKDIPDSICGAVSPVPWNKLFRRQFVQDTGLQYLPLSTTNDITFAVMSTVCAARIAYLPKAYIYYRTGHTGTVTSKKRKNLDNVIKAALEVDRLSAALPYYGEIKESVREFVAETLFVGLEQYAGSEDTPEYRGYADQVRNIFLHHPLFCDMKPEDFVHEELFQKVAGWRDGCVVSAGQKQRPLKLVAKGLRYCRERGLRRTADRLLVAVGIKRP